MAYFKKIRAVQVAVLLGGLFVGLAMAKQAKDMDEAGHNEIIDRIKPVGSLCVTGDECAAGGGVAVVSGPRSGEQIYNSYCTVCHAVGILNAPKKGDKHAWGKRMADSGSFAAMLENSLTGIRAMPPKGTCADCSNDELSGAIEYMSGLAP